MPASVATSGFGCLLKRGDGGAGAGVQASRTVGTANQQIVLRAKNAGTAGNSKTVSILVSGNNTAFAISVTANNVTITSATSGAGAATTTVGFAIAQLYLNSTFIENWQATTGAGDGSGVLVAASSAALTGGTDGGEIFTNIAEVKSISGPNTSSQIIDVTHMESDNSTREFLPSLIDPGEISFNVNWLPTNTSHTGLAADQRLRIRRNFQLVFSNTAATTLAFAGYVTAVGITAEIESVLQGAITIKLTSWPF